MPLRRTLRRFWAHLKRATGRELAVIAGAAALFAAASLIQPYNTERGYLREQSQRVRRDHLSLPDRLGYATLLRGGYGTVRMVTMVDRVPVTDSVPQDKDVQLRFETNEEHPDWRCIGNPRRVRAGDGQEVRTRELTVALVAAERYNRDGLQRRLEQWAARTSLRTRHRLPEYSLGAAQIRPSTARRVLAAELGGFAPSDRELLALLVDECLNVRLAGRHVQELAIALAPAAAVPDSLISRVALAYNGAGATPTINGLRYADAVRGAYQLLTEEPQDEAADFEEEKDAPAPVCIYFSVGSVSALEDPLTLGQLDLGPYAGAGLDSARARVRLVAEEHGPPSYLARLQARRREWIVGQLARLGIQQGSISFVAPGSLPRMSCTAPESVPHTSAALWITGLPVLSPAPAASPGGPVPPSGDPPKEPAEDS